MKKKQEQLDEEMTDNKMVDLLVDLSNTIYWQAIKRIIRKKDIEISQALFSLDAFKEPTLVARNQGARIGLYLLENVIEQELKRRQDENKAKQDGRTQEPDMPNYKF